MHSKFLIFFLYVFLNPVGVTAAGIVVVTSRIIHFAQTERELGKIEQHLENNDHRLDDIVTDRKERRDESVRKWTDNAATLEKLLAAIELIRTENSDLRERLKGDEYYVFGFFGAILFFQGAGFFKRYMVPPIARGNSKRDKEDEEYYADLQRERFKELRESRDKESK